MAKKLLTSPEFKDLSKKLNDLLGEMMLLNCMQCKAHTAEKIMKTVNDMITFIQKEA